MFRGIDTDSKVGAVSIASLFRVNMVIEPTYVTVSSQVHEVLIHGSYWIDTIQGLR